VRLGNHQILHDLLAVRNGKVNRKYADEARTDRSFVDGLVAGPEGEGPASGGYNDQGDKYQEEESLS
jgi:hypothetical protein